MLPALMKGPAMYLVFLDLSKELDKPYKIPFSRDDTVITPYDAKHTVLATISQILSSIASVHCISEQPITLRPHKVGAEFDKRLRNFQQVTPVAAVIGTHKDQLANPEEEIKRKSETLNKVTENFEKILVTPGSTTSSTSNASFFTVDNMDGTERSEMVSLRDFLSKIFSTHFKDASLPIKKKWLLMGIILRREFKIASLEDCYAVGEILEMQREEVRHCLMYLHDTVGTLMFYTDILDDDWFKTHVICSTQVVFDSTSKLIVASLRTLHCEGHVTKFERRELIKKGQFSLESIEMYCLSAQMAEKEDIIPAKQLITLLQHVNLLSPITHSANDSSKKPRVTYLMPTILECASRNELSKPPKPDVNNPEPIHITFEFGFVPTGAFCGLITRLVSEGPGKILGLTWAVVEDGVKRNCVSFHVAKSNMVTLIAHERSYEIRVTRAIPQMSLQDLCSYVLSVLQYMLQRLYKHLVPQVAFQCPCPDHNSERDDLCIMTEDFWVQFLCGSKPVALTEHQQVWFGKMAVPGQTITLGVLTFLGKQAPTNLSFHWSKVGEEDTEPPVNPGKPNILTFQSVSEGDYGYYQCEVKEAGKAVLTLYRALYKEQSTNSIPHTASHCFVSESYHHSIPDTSYTQVPSHPCVPNQHHPCTATADDGPVEEFLKTSNLNITSKQLNYEIQLADMPIITRHFDGVELYVTAMGLCAADEENVKNNVPKGIQVAMTVCLRCWRRDNPSGATYRGLVDILLKLGKEEIARKVCEYAFPKHK